MPLLPLNGLHSEATSSTTKPHIIVSDFGLTHHTVKSDFRPLSGHEPLPADNLLRPPVTQEELQDRTFVDLGNVSLDGNLASATSQWFQYVQKALEEAKKINEQLKADPDLDESQAETRTMLDLRESDIQLLQKTQKEAQWFASLPGSFVIRSWQENKIRRLLFRVSVVHTGATSSRSRLENYKTVHGETTMLRFCPLEGSNFCTLQFKMNDPFAHGSYGFVHRGLLDGYDGASARMEVAIKRPNSIDMTPWARKVERFENEAKIWMLLRHPNICPFLAFIEYNSPTGNDICLVSPWSSLAAARLQTASKFAAKFRNHVFLIISGIIDGLLFMHSQEPPVLHGDVKGNNVIMFGDIDHPVPCLTDFGLSRFIQPSAVEHSVTGGNERWTAPEIIENHRQRKAILQTYTSTVPDGPKPHSAPELELTEKSDVWSLAMTIIELITGKVPFADMPQWRVQSIFEEGPTFYAPEIQEYLRCLPMGIRQILLPCLDERPAQRPSMASVKEQWVSFLAISGGSSLDELMDEVEPSYRSYSNPDLTAWQEFIESVRKKIHNIESP